MWEEFDYLNEQWFRRQYWIWAARPPIWNIRKYLAWRRVWYFHYFDTDLYFTPRTYHPGRG